MHLIALRIEQDGHGRGPEPPASDPAVDAGLRITRELDRLVISHGKEVMT